MKIKLIPQNNRIIVQEIEEKYSGGLVKSQKEMERNSIAKIVAIADGVKNYAVGDIVIYNEFEGAEVPRMKDINDEKGLIVIDINEVLIKVDKKDLKKSKDELGFKR